MELDPLKPECCLQSITKQLSHTSGQTKTDKSCGLAMHLLAITVSDKRGFETRELALHALKSH
jgi:hypothetical protein